MNFFSFVLAATFAVNCLATPVANAPGLVPRRASTPSGEGVHDGFYYSWWSDGQGESSYANKAGGTYSVDWAGAGNFVGGKGFKPGVYDRELTYSGTFNPVGKGYLSVYGWILSMPTETYIVESYTEKPAPGGTVKGTANCNGAKYDIVESFVVPPGGNIPILTYYSIRNPSKPIGAEIRGTVSTACHYDAWKGAGLSVEGKIAYQILATEGYSGEGSSTITVSST